MYSVTTKNTIMELCDLKFVESSVTAGLEKTNNIFNRLAKLMKIF